MAISIKHKFVSEVADGGDANRVQPSDWNDEHEVEGLGALATLGTVGTSEVDDSSITLAKLNSDVGTIVGRNLTISTSPPSGGSNGDIWIEVEA